MADIRSTDRRLLRVLTVSQWIALTLGILAGIVTTGGALQSYIAAAAGGVYVLTTTALPASAITRPLVLEAVSLV